jgi:hypothetical protein
LYNLLSFRSNYSSKTLQICCGSTAQGIAECVGIVTDSEPRSSDTHSCHDRRAIPTRSVATATPTPSSAPASAPPTPTPESTPTTQPAAPEAPAPKVKLPSHFDDRLAQPWSELMSSTATTRSGEKMTAFLRRVVDETDLEVTVGDLRPNVGGELRTVASMDGDKAKIIQSAITTNKEVMNESPRVLAALLAHEITHANQPVTRRAASRWTASSRRLRRTPSRLGSGGRSGARHIDRGRPNGSAARTTSKRSGRTAARTACDSWSAKRPTLMRTRASTEATSPALAVRMEDNGSGYHRASDPGRSGPFARTGSSRPSSGRCWAPR